MLVVLLGPGHFFKYLRLIKTSIFSKVKEGVTVLASSQLCEYWRRRMLEMISSRYVAHTVSRNYQRH
jgi:hypothetical protein